MGTNSLNSLDNLYSLLNSSRDDIFDVKSIIENQKIYEQLIRLLRTYKEYLNKESSLKYFGFVGHFSSGKSSTINSILKSETEDERKEGLHPIDTGITVISHSDNRNRFIVTQNNSGLAAGYQLVDNEILKNSVFVDTPGSGDEKTLSELVTDYLPICDKIIFIISATQPLTESEIPIFKEVCENLKFLPICLVVTRADEFRKDKLKIFNKENFSLEDYRSFETELISRLTQVTKDNRFNNSTIIPINNIDGFGIEALRGHICETIEEKDFNISSIKDDFFRQKGKKIILHFKSYIEKKDNELIHLKNTSDRNHKEFSSKAELHNNKLTENWRERKDALDGVLKSVHSFHLSISDDIQTAENFNTGIHKEELLSKINEDFRIYAIDKFDYLLNTELNRITKEIKETIQKPHKHTTRSLSD